MECKKVESFISKYIENDVTEQERKEISSHLKQCKNCQQLKENIENMIYLYPELQEEIPFFLKNKLYNIFEFTEEKEIKYGYSKWVAAGVGTLVLFLNLFYFTNIYPAANKSLHIALARVEKFVVETKAFIEEFKVSNKNVLFGFFKKDSDMEKLNQKKSSNKKGGKNG
ncbi:MAG: zf-HC2 domain-containing protein [Candidatus Aminicenantes bacterium]|nr:zf-HC2 domain-containing protein [Candidatus Aminicenantes bacterium]